jgi:hypothetical protein
VGETDGFLNFFANGYCTQDDTACGSKGLCDQTSVVFSEVSCQCLGGYSGDQCGDCQTGYFGSTCDLCPEGGDEDRDAPRLTDTCGIAGSGRSRGSCDDGVAGDGTCTCYGIFSGSDCTEGTCPAGTIETAAFEGYFNVAECTSCDAGTYSAEGDDQCTNCDAGEFSDIGAGVCSLCPVGEFSSPGASECEPCAEGTYSSLPGQASCKQCPPFSTTLAEGATGCYSCLEDYYFSPFAVDLDDGGSVPCDNSIKLAVSCERDSTKCFDQCCLSCERGMDCENATSNTLTAVPIEDGWWRASSYSDEVYQCQYSGACKKGKCAEGHEGVACRVCKNDYHRDALKNRCVECKGNSLDPLTIASGACLVALVLAVIVVACRSGGEDALLHAKGMAKGGIQGHVEGQVTDAVTDKVDKVLGDVHDAVLGDDKEDDAPETERRDATTSDDATSTGQEGNGSTWAETRRSLHTKFKIILGVCQIQDALPWTIPTVSFPKAFEALIAWTSFLEFNVVQILPIACLRPFNFFDKLLAMTILPIVFSLLIFLFGESPRCARPPKRRNQSGPRRSAPSSCSHLSYFPACPRRCCASTTA